MPDISIVIVSWNAKAHLLKCLSSLVAEPGGIDNEIIVVDNASSDGSPEAVRIEFPSVRLVKNGTNLGFAKANNIGITASEGRYIYLVNSDIVVMPGAIERLRVFMDKRRDVGLAGPRILNPDGTLQNSCRRFPSLRRSFFRMLALDTLFPRSATFAGSVMGNWAHDSVRSVDMLSGCFGVVRREALDQVGLLDEDFFMYGEDCDWSKRFHAGGWDVVYFPEAEAVHYGGGSSDNAPTRCFVDLNRANHHYWEKHHNKLAQKMNLVMVFVAHLLRLAVKLVVYTFVPSKGSGMRRQMENHLAVIKWMVGWKGLKMGEGAYNREGLRRCDHE